MNTDADPNAQADEFEGYRQLPKGQWIEIFWHDADDERGWDRGWYWQRVESVSRHLPLDNFNEGPFAESSAAWQDAVEGSRGEAGASHG